MPKRETLAERFEAKVDRSGGPDACHLWTAGGCEGYGKMAVGSKTDGTRVAHKAHRIAYEMTHGPAGDSVVMHTCDVRRCVNPAHLRLGTRAENNADRDAKGRGADTRGEGNGNAKLCAEDVRAIRVGLAKGERTLALAARYGVGDTAIRNIGSGATWRHV